MDHGDEHEVKRKSLAHHCFIFARISSCSFDLSLLLLSFLVYGPSVFFCFTTALSRFPCLFLNHFFIHYLCIFLFWEAFLMP